MGKKSNLKQFNIRQQHNVEIIMGCEYFRKALYSVFKLAVLLNFTSMWRSFIYRSPKGTVVKTACLIVMIYNLQYTVILLREVIDQLY